MKKINIGKNVSTLVDDKDFYHFSSIKWEVGGTGYIVNRKMRKGKKIMLFLHRLITNCPSNLIVDHINHNILDNRKSNLRICTRRENSFNRAFDGKKQDKCIYQRASGRLFSVININYKSYVLGTFNTKEEAIIAYNLAAIQSYGEFAYLNS